MQGSSAVKKMISRCVTCRRLRGRVVEQIMADLPSDRLKEEPPFTHCGVDIFGPFFIKERRNTLKRYEALFTCLASHAIHIEMIKNMDTDSSILALRRFIGRHGNIRTIQCDSGSNFVGAERESKLNVGRRSIRRKLGSSCYKTVLIGFSGKGILH